MIYTKVLARQLTTKCLCIHPYHFQTIQNPGAKSLLSLSRAIPASREKSRNYSKGVMSQASYQLQMLERGGTMKVVSVDRPRIEADDELQINIKAVALQPIDMKQWLYGVRVSKWPNVGGMNGAGIVTDAGKGVKRFKVGDEVFSFFIPGNDRSGAFQEYPVIKEVFVAKKPAALSWEEAASLPTSYLTAIGGIYKGLDIQIAYLPKLESPLLLRSIIVLGGSSSVGATAIQLLRHSLGPDTTILTTCSAKHQNNVTSVLGANHAFERDAPLNTIRAATPGGKGVDAMLSCVEAVPDRPELLELLDPSGPKRFAEIISGKNTQSVPDGVKFTPSHGFMAVGVENLWEGFEKLLEAGKFRLPVEIDVVGQGLVNIGTAIRLMHDQGVSGKKLVVSL